MAEETKEKEAVIKENNSEQAENTDKKAEPKNVVTSITSDLNFLAEVRTDLPSIRTGSVVKVYYRVIEGGKERVQVFEGTVIAIKNRGIAKNVTVRKTSFGISVERIFPLNSKLVQKIEVKKLQKVRRSKLYYLRNLKGKAARLKELR